MFNFKSKNGFRKYLSANVTKTIASFRVKRKGVKYENEKKNCLLILT